ncbi:LWR-salt protein [Halalkalicoccus subterraneus]|uniref:LWR-salt protein n=1 Tax=Halalkalicoccus subterraneus TaxID=2675002 RepID=UPI000EFB8E86|nr:LWR-salt protein [Halalkalicoccus subterraneus]
MSRYVFHVRFRPDPDRGFRIEPATFETSLSKAAAPPGEEGWLFFRNNLWRGEVNAPGHMRSLAEGALGVPVEAVEYRRFETTEGEYAALKEAIAANLDRFNAETGSEVLNKYFGSSIEVEPDG